MRPEEFGDRSTRRDRPAPAALSMEASSGQRALVAVAATLQVIVMALTFVSGMLWAGWPYVVANVVAILGLVLVLVVGSRTGRRNVLVALLAVPVISIGLIVGLANFNEWRLARVACSDREREAVAGLESPSGEPLSFDG